MAVTQTMEINGQTVNNLVENNLAFKVKLLGNAEENLKLQITIDSLFTKVESTQGATGGKIKDVEGKTFNMILSPHGKEIDLGEAEKIEYGIEGSPNTNLSAFFSNIFPDLSEKAIKPGDTWSGNDSIKTLTATSKTIQYVQSTNKFEGIEKINGLECAKISSTVSGTQQINVQNMGMDVLISGPFQGTVTLYFAIKEGYFVSQETSTKMNGTVEISGPQSMSFPMLMDTRSKIETKN
jgi:hypothetical protein